MMASVTRRISNTKQGMLNSEVFVQNNTISAIDILGLSECECLKGSNMGKRQKENINIDDIIDNKCTAPTGDIVFIHACQIHDQCYATCNNDRAACDWTFYMNMQKDCEKNCDGVICLTACYIDANMYYVAVRAFGDSPVAGDQSYSKLQEAVCEDCCCI